MTFLPKLFRFLRKTFLKPARRKSFRRRIKKKKRVVHRPKAKPPKLKKDANGAPGVLIGEITHFFPKISVVVVKTTHSAMRVGDRIEIVGPRTRFSQVVESLQIESVDVHAAGKGKLVGLKTDRPARAGDKVYRVKSLEGQSAIEYMLLVGTVILVLIAFLIPGGPFHNKLNTTVTQSVDQLESMVNDFNVIP